MITFHINIETWIKLFDLKLTKWKLDSSPKPISILKRIYKDDDEINLYYIDHLNFDSNVSSESNGSLIVHNSLEEFKTRDRKQTVLNTTNKDTYGELNTWIDFKNYQVYYDCYIKDTSIYNNNHNINKNKNSTKNGLWVTRLQNNVQTPIHIVNMKQHIDAKQIAMDSIKLNLDLMKWRVLPDLDLTNIMDKKVALFGMGTLGCAAARQLLAWGITNLTLIDKGTVSYSNPVRQNLYTYQDAEQQRFKVTAAKEQLLLIAPYATVTTHQITIPMKDHVWTEQHSMTKEIAIIDDIIAENDIILLLTDSRESRWVVSFLAQHKPNKMVMTMALGFGESLIKIHQPGKTCYFCNDLDMPSNTDEGKTLDQMCTVTRPGLAYQVTSMGIEMMVKEYATPSNILGTPVNETRFYMHDNSIISSDLEKNKECICCSDALIEASKEDPKDFVYKVLNNTVDIEAISGLTEMQKKLNKKLNIEVKCEKDDF
jgi:ubiquitin-like modifier-activating enzyme ATG7